MEIRLPSEFADEFIPGHGHEEFNELLRLFQLILAEGGTDEKAGQNRLANINGVEAASEAPIAKPQSNLAADFRFVLPNQLCRRLLIASADAFDELKE
jgi:hypothetical protein